MSASALVEVVEASYRAVGGGDVDAWLNATIDALLPALGTGHGIVGYRFDARGDPRNWTITKPIVRDGSPAIAIATEMLFAIAPPELRVPLYRPRDRAHTLSELNGYALDELPLGDASAFAKQIGIRDIVGLNAGDASGRGAVFGVPSAKRCTLRPSERQRLARLAGHLAAAHRLTTAFADDMAPTAIFAPTGKLLDAAKPLDAEDATPLRAAVRAMDRARGALRRKDPDEALRSWRALVEGRYSLLDRFESDGKRFVVAYENPPGAHDPRGLTPRESAIAALLAMALPDKQIAYEVGLSEGTVRAHVHHVLTKLGATTRAAAIDLLAPPEMKKVMPVGAGGASVVVFTRRDGPADGRDPLEALTAIEREIALLAARGISTEAIAKKRGRSKATIAKQVSRVFDKVGVGTRAELARKLQG